MNATTSDYNPDMRRFVRWTLNALTALSLVMCAGTAGLWLRSHSVLDFASLRTEFRTYQVISLNGSLSIHRGIPASAKGQPSPWRVGSLPARGGSPIDNSKHNHHLAWLGFAYDSDVYQVGGTRMTHRGQDWFFPYWFVCLLLAIPPALRVRTWRENRRLAAIGKCPRCGYDLTGNVSGVCPECGREIKISAAEFSN